MMSEVPSTSSEATDEGIQIVQRGSENQIGRLLRRARHRAGLTQREVAQRTGMMISAISRIENHGSDLRVSTLERVAAAVGCKLALELRPADGD